MGNPECLCPVLTCIRTGSGRTNRSGNFKVAGQRNRADKNCSEKNAHKIMKKFNLGSTTYADLQ